MQIVQADSVVAKYVKQSASQATSVDQTLNVKLAIIVMLEQRFAKKVVY